MLHMRVHMQWCTWGCACGVYVQRCVGGACAITHVGVHAQWHVLGVSLQLISLCGGVSLQLIRLYVEVSLQLIKLHGVVSLQLIR